MFLGDAIQEEGDSVAHRLAVTPAGLGVVDLPDGQHGAPIEVRPLKAAHVFDRNYMVKLDLASVDRALADATSELPRIESTGLLPDAWLESR